MLILFSGCGTLDTMVKKWNPSSTFKICPWSLLASSSSSCSHSLFPSPLSKAASLLARCCFSPHAAPSPSNPLHSPASPHRSLPSVHVRGSIFPAVLLSISEPFVRTQLHLVSFNKGNELKDVLRELAMRGTDKERLRL